MKARGKEADSGALVGSGSDALFDAVLSFSVLVAALVYLQWGIPLESYVGAFIACFILRSGYGLLRDTLNEILGERPDPQLVREIKNLLVAEPEIRGAYDLMINNYGPGRNYASVHIELPDVMTVEQVDRLTHRINRKIFQATGVHLSGVTVYSCNTRDPEAAAIREKVSGLVMKHTWLSRSTGSMWTGKPKPCGSTWWSPSAGTGMPLSGNWKKKWGPCTRATGCPWMWTGIFRRCRDKKGV